MKLKDGKIMSKKELIDRIFTEMTGDVGQVSKVIRDLKGNYYQNFSDLDSEGVRFYLQKDLNELPQIEYPRVFDSAEYNNVIFDKETEHYGSRLVDFDDVMPYMKECERDTVGLLSPAERESFMQIKLEDFGGNNDLDFGEAKLDLYYSLPNDAYNKETYLEDVVATHLIIHKENAFSEKTLNSLFSGYFDEHAKFSKRENNQDVVRQCIDHIIDSQDKEASLEKAVSQYYEFRLDEDVNDVELTSASKRRFTR